MAFGSHSWASRARHEHAGSAVRSCRKNEAAPFVRAVLFRRPWAGRSKVQSRAVERLGRKAHIVLFWDCCVGNIWQASLFLQYIAGLVFLVGVTWIPLPSIPRRIG